MLHHTLFDLIKPSSHCAPHAPTRQPLTSRPRLEALEDRCVPSKPSPEVQTLPETHSMEVHHG